MHKFIAILLFSFGLFFLNAQSAQAQNKKIDTATFFVDGVCNMCKERIENAAYQKGVKTVEWNKTEKQITVVFKTKKTDITTIKQNIADAGHDTDTIKASEEAYNSISNCCRYKTLETH